MEFKNGLIFPVSIALGGAMGWFSLELGDLSINEWEGIVPVISGMGGGLCFGVATWISLEKKESHSSRKGSVKWFSSNKGFGFIEQDEGEDLFVHRTEILNDQFRSLNKNDRVEFEVGHGKKGPVAKKVRKISIPQQEGHQAVRMR